MFKRARPDLIVSDEGFSIEEFPGRVGNLIYREGEREVKIWTELLATPDLYRLFPNNLQWNSPCDEETIDHEKRDAIVDNIRRAYRYFGHEIHIEIPDPLYHGAWTEEDFDYFEKKGFKVIRPPGKGEEE
jgi:hypothetical protein